ncbi:MAG: serine hydrolase [Planctomycetes bacterium]|nr:serine hydrolase [Planctomycetota bacterium]
MSLHTFTLAILLCAPPSAAASTGAASTGPDDERVKALLEQGRERWREEARLATDADVAARLLGQADRMHKVLTEAPSLRAQVLVGEVVERDGKRELVAHGWRLGAEYFYPASTVKLFGAVAALERLRELRGQAAPRFTVDTPLSFYGSRRGGAMASHDADNIADGKLTLRHLIRESLIVSDNESFNRLFEFVGHDPLNERMWRAGLSSTRISHRLSIKLSILENRRTPTIELRMSEGVVRIAEATGKLELANIDDREGVLIGKGRIEGAELVPGPMSFLTKNRVTLRDLQVGLARVVRPELAFEGEPFDLGDEERALLLEALSQYPGDSTNPRWDRARYPDDYVKFLLPGVARVLPKEHVRIYNKVGLGYGFVTDNAYIVDTRTQRGFFLAATIYANSDGVLDDDKYDYDSFGFPWMADLGELFAREFLASK